MTAKTLMILGTHSNAGKSILVTALCRIFAQDGYRVAPFKAQNMALNAGVTPEGHEIGRATIAQAEAAGIPAHVDMNPILLKPEGNRRSQVVLNGKPYTHIDAGNWHSLKPTLWQHVTAALDRLRQRYDLVIMEGAGSPAEINLKEGDIVNLKVAQYAQAPVLLVGDIDRGGVFATLVGTMVLLEPAERALVKGFVLNKFRGDLSLLGNGLQMLQEWAFNTPTLGVIPYLPHIGIAAEDSVALDEQGRLAEWQNADVSPLDIAVIRLPRISNFDDFDPLATEPGVQVRFVERLETLGAPNAVILPGSKMTLADLEWLRLSGLAEQIIKLAHNGRPVVGICGGYQMLGQSLLDPQGVEAAPGTRSPGLGLLPVETVFAGDKHTVQVQATLQAEVGPLAALRGTPLQGYEIHIGRSQPTDSSLLHSLCRIGRGNEGHRDGALNPDGRIWGTYLHGLFDNDALRHAWLRSLGWQGAGQVFDRQQAYNRLADHVRAHLDMAAVEHIVWQYQPEQNGPI
ncbi:MAG: cobyric acid synthase [Anaerolineae bacterium]|nr:cobyric acid synthase [Anaerolineae bacterium]